jgi:hypothetical protein
MATGNLACCKLLAPSPDFDIALEIAMFNESIIINKTIFLMVLIFNCIDQFLQFLFG